MLHPITWLVWTGVVAAASMLTRNPLYLSILLGVATVNYLSVDQQRPDARGWRSLLRLTSGLALLIVPFNALNVHAGRHVLFRLPSAWPLIGGNITLEAVVWGMCSALGLLGLIVVFATFHLNVSQAQILRLTPAFIYEAGLIVSIALTFIPQMINSAREIREAQLIRGHRIRRVRDTFPLLMALLTTGLERSFQLAESIEARGFGNVRDPSQRRDTLYKALTLVALGGTISGLFIWTYFPSMARWGLTSVALSAVLLLGTFWAQGRRVLRTHYRRDRWTWRDIGVLTASLGVVATLVIARIRRPAALPYYPYVELKPAFDPVIGGVLITLALPAVLRPASDHGYTKEDALQGKRAAQR
jgi:energy-coupling factor transport system permease protein